MPGPDPSRPAAELWPPVTPGHVPQYAPSYAPQYVPMVMVPQYAASGYPPPAPAAPGNFFLPSAAPPRPRRLRWPRRPPRVMPRRWSRWPPLTVCPRRLTPLRWPTCPRRPSRSQPSRGQRWRTLRSRYRRHARRRVSGSGGRGLLGAGLARLGQRLTQFGRTRIETVQETVLDTPQVQPLGGVATISTIGTTPAQTPVAPTSPPAAPEAPQEGPAPSPQGEVQKHSLLRHLLGHD